MSIVATLESQFTGELIRPDDPGYDEARKRLQRGDRQAARADRALRQRRPTCRPRWPTRASTTSSSRSAAAATRPPGTPRCDDGIVIDTGPMKHVEIDVEARTGPLRRRADLGRARRRHPGARAGRDRRARDPHRRRRPHARQRLGLARPQVRDDLREPDLRRGRDRRRHAWCAPARTRTPSCSGGSRAAAATSAWSPSSSSGCTRSGPIVYAGMIMHPRSAAPELLRFYRDFMEQAPDEVGGGAGAAHRAAGGLRPRGGAGQARRGPDPALRRRSRRRARRSCGRWSSGATRG